MDAGGPGPLRGSVPSAVGSELSFLRDTWRHRTRPRAGSGSGAVGPVRKVPDPWGLCNIPVFITIKGEC